ncbi:MAG: 4Fe-4S binding protein, partial [Candidatus Alkanophagales archaeon]
ARVVEALCKGCGTCVAACPPARTRTGTPHLIGGRFISSQVVARIEICRIG